MKSTKRLNLRLDDQDWAELMEAKDLSRAKTIAQTLRDAVRRHLSVERERVRLEKAKEAR